MMGSWLQLGWLKRAVGRKLPETDVGNDGPSASTFAPAVQLEPVVKIVVAIKIISVISIIIIVITSESSQPPTSASKQSHYVVI